MCMALKLKITILVFEKQKGLYIDYIFSEFVRLNKRFWDHGPTVQRPGHRPV